MEAELPKTDPPKRKRRWLQFSLRTLLIGVTFLAVPCAYVGWQAKIVRERHAMIERIITADRGFLSDDNELRPNAPKSASNSIPCLRRLLGDVAIWEIWLPISTTPGTRREVQAVFPEARIHALTDEDPLTHSREVIEFPKDAEAD
jgi:hypothetical protein